MVQKYILAASDRGAVISMAVATSTAKALMKKHPNIVGRIDLYSSSWAQSLFRRIGFVRRRHTSAKVNIPDKARKEIEYQFHYEIVSKVERHGIPDALIINLDQTPCQLVPCRKQTMAKKGSKNVVIAGASDKRSITATFAISLSGQFLPMQLIYGGKTTQSLPRFKFPDSFSLSVNEKHFSNTKESIRFINEIIVPYVEITRSSNGLQPDHKALVVMDVFTGQMTKDVLDLYKKNNIVITNVPPNMTKFYQPLDLTVNGFAKLFMAKKFNDWYSAQVLSELDKGTPLEEIDIKLRLSLLKPLHAGWLLDLYNHMTSDMAKGVIESGWASSGIRDAVAMGLSKLQTIDPFDDLDPLMETSTNLEPDFQVVCSLTEEEIGIGYSKLDNVEGEEESVEADDYEWESRNETRGAFSIFDDFDDENL